MKSSILRIAAEVDSLGNATEYLRRSGDAVLVKRGHYRWLALICPCGCSDELRINLDPAAGPAWQIYYVNHKLTIYPSIWREGKCESHFIIWRNYVLGLEMPTRLNEEKLKNRILQVMTRQLSSNEDLAKRVDSDPWTVLFLCRQLVRDGFAEEGMGRARGNFKKKGKSQLAEP